MYVQTLWHGAGVRQPPWPVSVDQQSTRSVVDDWPCLVLVKDEVSGVWLSLDQDRMKSVVCDCRWLVAVHQTMTSVVGAPRPRQIPVPAPHHSIFYRPDALPATQPTASKHW